LPDRGRLGLRRADANFWWVDNLALDGQTDRATALFGRLLGHANDPGLLPEEVDPASGQLLGSFLQAFSYVGLIRAAINLNAAIEPTTELRPADPSRLVLGYR
jgi:GH15 family glucan-1,4-alpha-glucosidase